MKVNTVKNNTNSKYSTKEICYIVCIVLFAGLIRIPSLTQPIGPDQGIMAVIGEGILNGKLPYRDFWEMASPAIFFTYALMFKIFGVSMAAIPITDTIVSMFTTFLVFLFAKTIWDKKIGYASSFLFALFSSGIRLGTHAAGDVAFGTFWYVSQRETFMLPLITASFFFIIVSERRKDISWQLILSGFLAGLTFVYKFPSLIFFACVLAYLNWNHILTKDHKEIKKIIIKNIVLTFGFILALIPFVLFFSIKGAMEEMNDIIFKYVYSVYGQLDHNALSIIKVGLRHTLFIAKENFVLWGFFFASSIYIVFTDRTKENLLVVLWGLASCLYVISHREFFGYHYLMILPPFSILAGYGFIKTLGTKFNLHQIFTVEIRKTIIIFAVLANIFIFTTLNHMHYTKFIFYITGKITKESYYNFFTAYPKHDYSFPADYKVSQYIIDNTDAEDLIFSLGGIESVIYFLTKRKSPSRFIFSWIIFYYAHGKTKEAAIYRKELLNDLKTKIPKYIITVRSLETFKQFADIYKFIKNNYRLEKTFPDDRFIYASNS